MERHASAVKAARQALKRQARNRAALSECKTVVRHLKDALAKKSSKEELKKAAAPLLNEVQRVLMKAAHKKILKKETVSRKIARLSHEVHTATA